MSSATAVTYALATTQSNEFTNFDEVTVRMVKKRGPGDHLDGFINFCPGPFSDHVMFYRVIGDGDGDA